MARATSSYLGTLVQSPRSTGGRSLVILLYPLPRNTGLRELVDAPCEVAYVVLCGQALRALGHAVE
eukprot:4295506-Alexandrium_andersonii.AAC.1